jgi:hypothetical protein
MQYPVAARSVGPGTRPGPDGGPGDAGQEAGCPKAGMIEPW